MGGVEYQNRVVVVEIDKRISFIENLKLIFLIIIL